MRILRALFPRWITPSQQEILNSPLFLNDNYNGVGENGAGFTCGYDGPPLNFFFKSPSISFSVIKSSSNIVKALQGLWRIL